MERTQRRPLSTLASGFIGLSAVTVLFSVPLVIVMAGTPANQVLLTTL